MQTLIALSASILSAVLIVILIASIQTLIDAIDEWQERRKRIRQLNILIDLWTRLADEERDPLEKGYKTARLLNLEYERKLMNNGRNL